MKKEEGAAGSVLGGGSFLRREGVPGTRKKASVIERRRGFSWFQDKRTKRRGVWLVTSLAVEEVELLVGKTPGGVYCS